MVGVHAHSGIATRHTSDTCRSKFNSMGKCSRTKLKDISAQELEINMSALIRLGVVFGNRQSNVLVSHLVGG
jgi:hypothetical protein